MKPMLTPNGQQLMNEFLRLQPQLQQLEHEAFSQLQDVLKAQGVELNAIESRVKAEASLRGKLERKGDKYHSLSDITELRGKLERKGDKYHSLSDITDLVGIRIITFYTDDVDKVAGIVKRLFAVDWSNSIDKRKAHELTSFGYNSLHYICRLKGDGPLSSIPFEIQMRTALQHVWSAIEHDIGYKGVVQLPPEFRRQFSRLRITMTEYRRQVQSLVKSGKLDEVPLSNDSFRSYLELRPFDRLNQRIAAINQAELFPVSLMMFMPLLEHFHMETLGDVQRMLIDNGEDAYQLALSQLAITDLDILSESVGLQNLCIIHAIRKGEGRAGVLRVFETINGLRPSMAIIPTTRR